MQTKSTET